MVVGSQRHEKGRGEIRGGLKMPSLARSLGPEQRGEIGPCSVLGLRADLPAPRYHFVVSTADGPAYEVYLEKCAHPEGCSALSIRSEGIGTNGPWIGFQAAGVPGARRAVVNGILADAAEDLSKGQCFGSIVRGLLEHVDAALLEVFEAAHPLSALSPGNFRSPAFQRRAEALQLLADYRINCNEWGTGISKPLSSLLNEIERGESRLLVDQGVLVRRIEVARIKVFYQPPTGEALFLAEAGQKFHDGRVRIRRSEYSLAEKIMGETAAQAAARAFREELQIETVPPLKGGSLSAVRGECADFPGLISEKVFTNFSAWLTQSEFKPEGYTEIQADKCTVFRWVPQGWPGTKAFQP